MSYKLVVNEKVAPVINFSHQTILNSLEETMEKYKNIVVTEETVKGNKKVLAELNSAKKEIDTFRKNVKKEMSAPIKEFEEKCKEIIGKVDEVYGPIKFQMESYAEQMRIKKEADVKLVIGQTQEEIPLKPEYLERVELKSKYLNATETLTKVKADLIIQFNALKMEQDMVQQKNDTVKTLVEAYNAILKFKYSVTDFDYLMQSDVATISATIKTKAEQRQVDEKAELERIAREKEEAIQRAREEAERKAKAEAELKERQARELVEKHERERLAELKRIELENQRKIEEIKVSAQQEAIRTTENIVESVEKFIPVEAIEKDIVNDYMLEVKATEKQLEVIEHYLEASGIKLLHVEVL